MKTLRGFGPQAAMATPLLIELLGNPNLQSRGSNHPAKNVLVAIGKTAVPDLIKALQHDNSAIAKNTAECLRLIGDPRAAIPLAEAALASEQRLQGRPLTGVADNNSAEVKAVPEPLSTDASQLIVRLAKLLQHPMYSRDARAALAFLKATPELQVEYERLSKIVESIDDKTPNNRKWSWAWQCLQCATQLYEIDSQLSQPLTAEIDRALRTCATSVYAQSLGEEALKLSNELGYRPQQFVAEYKKVMEANDFMHPDQRTFYFYALASFEPENPEWLRRLKILARRKPAPSKHAIKYLELLQTNTKQYRDGTE